MEDARATRLEQLAWTDLKGHHPPTVVVPVGSCEQHGPHLPLGTDTQIATELALGLAARRAGLVVAPALAITASGEHEGFPGTLSIGTEVMAGVIIEVARSADWATGVVFVNGHGGNAAAMQRATEVFEHERRNVLVWWPRFDLVDARFDPHAGHTETSLMLAVSPDRVRIDEAVSGPVPTLAELVTHGVLALSGNGVLGDPAGASAEVGEVMLARLIDQLVGAVDDAGTESGVSMSDPASFRLDGSVRRYGTTLIGGSPLKVFRLTDAGNRVVDRIAAGATIDATALVGRLLDSGVVHPTADRPGPYSTEDVTIVVPTLGPPRFVPDGAIVVDDGSEPAVVGAAIRLDANVGPGAARNAGLAAVETALVAFVDADVELPDGWLDRLLPHFADPRVGAVAPRVVTPVREASSITTYEYRHSPLDMGAEQARVRAGTRVSYLPAAALVARVDAVASIGGFDTGLRFGEDVDLVWRLDDAGWRVRYEPASSVIHTPRGSWVELLRQRVGYGSSAGPLARRHPRKLAPLRMSGWSVLAWLLTAGGRPVAGAAVGVGSALALVPKLPDVPARESFRLAAMGNLRAGESIANTVRRAWWPIVAIAAIRSKAARRVLIACALAARDPRELADDVAYSLGVWRGMIAARTLDPIVPRVTSWPGRAATRHRRVTGYGRSS